MVRIAGAGSRVQIVFRFIPKYTKSIQNMITLGPKVYIEIPTLSYLDPWGCGLGLGWCGFFLALGLGGALSADFTTLYYYWVIPRDP